MKYKNAVLQMLERIKSEKSWKMIYRKMNVDLHICKNDIGAAGGLVLLFFYCHKALDER